MASRLFLLGSLVAAFEDDETMLLAHRVNVHKNRVNSSSMPEFVASTAAAPDCHAGSTHITSAENCWKACAALFPDEVANSKHRTFEREDKRWPNGCYVRTDGSASAKNKHCIFNVHDQSQDIKVFATQSLCVKDAPSDKKIKVIGKTSTQKWANSNGNFYIKFPGDTSEYSLYTGGNDFVKGQTDVWPLTVGPDADLTQPTIFIKEHNDAWIPQDITIEEGGAEVFKANGLKAIIDGNCGKAGIQWGNLFCAKSVTWPFLEVTVTVKTHTGKYANSNGRIYMQFEGDHRKYLLDTPKNDFEKGNTDTFKLYVENGADVTAGVKLSIASTDGWVPTSITVAAGGATHELKKAGTAELPFWLDGNCPGSKQKLSGKYLDCRSSWTFN